MKESVVSLEDTSAINKISEGVNQPVGGHELPGGKIIASGALIGAGLLLEPELLGGALIGAGVMYGLPLVGQILRPVATTAVQLGYSAVASVSDLLAGARDQVEGIVANARAGYQHSRDSSIISGR
jgi:hypothetical protein